MRRPPSRLWFVSTCALIALVPLLVACKPAVTDDAANLAGPAPSDTTATAPARLAASITSVVDGNTIEVDLDGRPTQIRLLSLDAPDRTAAGCFSNAATALVLAVAPPGTPLILERDTSDANPTGALLRYVYLPDGSMLNEQLLRGGFARFAPVEPDTKYLERLRAAEQEAQDHSAGLWAECREEPPATPTPDATALPTVTATPPPTPMPQLAGPSPTSTATALPTPTAPPTPSPTATPAPTPTPAPSPTPSPTATTAPTAAPIATADPRAGCDPSYPTVCIPPAPPDLDCGDIPYKRFQVLPPDPHRFDRDKDGIGCES